MIARGMAKEPDDRYQSAHELAAAARAALTDAAPPTFRRRRPLGTGHRTGDAAPTGHPSPRQNSGSGRGGGRRGMLLLGAFLRMTNQFPFHSVKPQTQVVLPFTGLDNPQGVAVDAKGDVYVTDSGNNRVLELAAGSTSQTVALFAGLNHPEEHSGRRRG